jgi:hypothetical protein
MRPIGVITDGDGNYRFGVNCIWLIVPCGARSVTLEFSEIDLEPGIAEVRVFACSTLTCNSESGITFSTVFTASYSGSRQRVTSCTGIMKVEFKPRPRYYDEASSYSGFFATYTSNISDTALSCPKSGRPPNGACSSNSSNTAPQRSSSVPAESMKINFPTTAAVVPASRGQRVLAKLSNPNTLTSNASLEWIPLSIFSPPFLGSDDTVSFVVILGTRISDFTKIQQQRLKSAVAISVDDPSLITVNQIYMNDFREVLARRAVAVTRISVKLDPDPSRNYAAACQLDKTQLEAVNKECGSKQVCTCIVDTVLSEDNPRICTEYATADSLFRNTIINCARRDCDKFQFVLVFLLLGGGGVLGGGYLCCANGCTFRPKEDSKTTEEEELEQQAVDFVDGLKPDAEAEGPAAEVDCCDGIDDGEIGVLAQLAIPYLVQSALEGASEEEV